ncbi:type II toxin-antitoxin system RelE family toxin [Candidatus Magnetominusculus xianensis]|uniref:Ddiction module toxin RelE n=1 Tax=Candidatus Magnetominusculus xianensis TaxID=1748249 RepID=A0ABR5SG08_9BACT|nr:ddiction module toxin RelE [Candidatus Magnetominusculus xianensis]MBF0405070.1 type II toxin-antitoxin system mRNA interferase toxin, RelE/StbE family [Nitrospirota bacterium]
MSLRKIVWSNNARCSLRKIDKPIIKRILDKIERLRQDLVTPAQLTGRLKGTFKLYVGDWRIVYMYESEDIVILDVGHRSNIYKS